MPAMGVACRPMLQYACAGRQPHNTLLFAQLSTMPPLALVLADQVMCGTSSLPLSDQRVPTECRCRAIFLHVISYNTPAMMLYGRSGYQVKGVAAAAGEERGAREEGAAHAGAGAAGRQAACVARYRPAGPWPDARTGGHGQRPCQAV